MGSSFNRLLLHRLSELYALDHHVEQCNFTPHGEQQKSVTIYKMNDSKFAEINLRRIDVEKLRHFHLSRLTHEEMQEWEEKKIKYSFNNYRANPNNSQQNGLANPNGNGTEHDAPAQFAEDDEGQKPVRMLLKKDNPKAFVNGNKSMNNALDNTNVQNVNNLDMKQEKYDKMKAKLFSAQAQNQQPNEQNDEEKVSVHSIAEEREGQTSKLCKKEIAAPDKEKNEKSKTVQKMEQTEGQRNEASKDKKENVKESAVKSNLNQIKKKCKGWSLVKPKRTTT